jgi:hypothetical protein
MYNLNHGGVWYFPHAQSFDFVQGEMKGRVEENSTMNSVGL